jgi:hypothetical protein
VHLQAGIEPTTAMQQIAATVPVAGVSMARLRLEDVFYGWSPQTPGGPTPNARSGPICRVGRSAGMNKILLIAQRDFLTTISNKGFLFGLFILPLMIGAALFFGPRLLSASRSPQVVGRVAVMDPTGQVLPELRSTLSASAIKARQEENVRRDAG